MRAVIMAGGKGTRLATLNMDIPKPMFPVLGKPILEYQIESLKKSGITDITLVVGHLREVVIDYFKDGKKQGVNINYIEESEPLGTAGALYYLKDEKEPFVLVFGDLILDIDFNRFMDFHTDHGAAITLYGHPNAHPYDSDVIEIDRNNRVTRILSKKDERNFFYHNFINAGIYCVSPDALESIKEPKKIDLEKTLITKLIADKKVYAYKSTEYVKDMGTPERLAAVTADVKNGIVAGRNLKKKQKAVFLDRDGTINEYVGFLRSVDEFRLLPRVSEAIARINASPYLAIVATNQPVIARGEVTFSELEEIHKKMETELGKGGAYLDDIFFCPHHPNKGYEGEVAELKLDCDCRKPKIGMLLQAAEKYNIDLGSSWFVGDTTMDIQTGKNAGMKTILVQTGEAGKDGKYNAVPDFTAEDTMEAVMHILN
ncbi:MAG: HAD-IIIA family hydrolase [Erysipelotrichaceae bacterium]|nr:HAD-IIIA family hydrolase [Clostridia bacterium]MBQ6217200.1 HAD-IIIA family hydrolase [Erysipelotrichaceae bacterium]